jgi:hypothetical protein
VTPPYHFPAISRATLATPQMTKELIQNTRVVPVARLLPPVSTVTVILVGEPSAVDFDDRRL